MVAIERDGLRYEFQLATRAGSLFDLRRDPEQIDDLARERPDDARRLHDLLERQLGVENLEELCEASEERIRDVRALGYL